MSTPDTKIAIVDEHEVILMAFTLLINTFPQCKVVFCARNGVELIDHLSAETTEQPDICIMDINMPALNGYDTVRQLKKSAPQIKVIALTAVVTEYAIVRMLKYGTNAFIPKAFPASILKEAIKTLCVDNYYYTSVASKKMFEKAKTVEIPDLTQREMAFLELCCQSLSYIEISRRMFVGVRTVENYYNSISKKLNVHDKASLITFARDSCLVYSMHNS